MRISYLRTGHSRPHRQRYAMEEYRRYRQGHSAIGQAKKNIPHNARSQALFCE